LLLAVFVLPGTAAVADTPWPQPPPGQDPYKYEEYCFSTAAPDDYSSAEDDFWMYTSEKSDSLYHALISLFNPDLYLRELEGVMGASVDRAWGITTGRPDVLIAELDSGIKWHDTGAMHELARKCHLNDGELPPPQGAASWDKNQDGVFNVDDYNGDPRLTDLNGNGMLDPQDLIWCFSDGEDDDANGYRDDICGWDFFEDDNDPWDELDYGHGTSECEWSAGEANNGSGIPGTCPNAMLLPVRVGDSFIVDINDFAQGVVFAVDSGAWVIQEALGAVNTSSLGQDAVDYAYSRGVAVIASAADEESAHQNFPCTYERTIQVNAVQKYNELGSVLVDQFPPSYLYLGGITNYGAHTIVSTPSGGHSSGATGRLAGITGLIYAAAENEVRRGEMWRYPGLDKPLSACEVRQLIATTADDIDFSPGSYGVSVGLLDLIIGPSQRFPSNQGWDPYFGYGRVNAYEAVRAVDEGRIPPEAEISYPCWFDLINPGQVSLDIVGRVAAVRADSFQYTVEWGPGWDPGEDEWITVKEAGYQYEPVEGLLATLDLGEVYRLVMETMEARGGTKDPNRYAFSIRVRVRDDRGNWGEDRKTSFCFDDPDAYPGTPFRMGSDIAASPRFADLDDDGENELIVATGEGVLHAYNSDFSEAAGWPVYTTPLPLHEGSEGFASGSVPTAARASVIGAPAVGDLDHDGTLEVVAGDTQGRMYAWDRNGKLLDGFPVRSNPLYSIPDREDWWTEGVLPADWYAARFVPDTVHQMDKWNCLDKAFLRGPVLSNLDGSADGSLEIIAACLDQHIYAWHGDGAAVSGWPVKLVDPEKVAAFDPLTHTCTFHAEEDVPRGSKIVTNPSVADLDGDGSVEVICGTNEAYTDEPFNVSPQNFGLAALLPLIEPLIGGAAGDLFNPGNTRAYAVHHDGSVHGLEEGVQPPGDQVPSQAYLTGWPVKLAMVAPGMLPNVLEGVNGPAAVADIDGDGSMEIGISSAAGPGFLLKPDGTSFLGSDGNGLPVSLESDEVGAAAESQDIPVMCALGGGCFADLGGYGLSYIAPTMGFGRAVDLFLPASQTRSDDQISAWSAADGSFLDPFPRKVNDMMFFASPGAADIDGDGSQEVLAGSSYYDLHAVEADGNEPAGWPKFTGGWNVATPPVADFDGDGDREVVMGTREGWLLAWETSSATEDTADWPEYGHDSWGTGCVETDALRPGRVTDLAAEKILDGEEPAGAKLTWTAPGDDGRLGQALCYEIRYLDRPIDEDNWQEAIPLETGKPMPAEAGTLQEFIVDGFPFAGKREGVTYHFVLQARDEAGNVSALSRTAALEYPAKVEPQEYTYSNTWYLAEGSTGGDARGAFETWILVQNPGEEAAHVGLTYMTPQGRVTGPAFEMPARSRWTVSVAETLPDTWEVSTMVRSDRPVIAERAVYWSAAGGAERQAAHDSIGVRGPSTTWYLAEGSTGSDDRGSFETWVLVQNPGDGVAMVNLTFMTAEGRVEGPTLELAPYTRRSVDVSETVPGNWHVSTLVEADRPVIAERAMYWSTPATYRQAAHDSIGVRGPSTTWYLAEGSTGGSSEGSFETYILVQNPAGEPATARLTFMTPEGEVEGPVIELAPGTRDTVDVSETVPGNWHVSTLVEADRPVIAERAMYWSTPATYRQAAHDSIGINEAATGWYLAEGSTIGISCLSDPGGEGAPPFSFETWVLIQNPGDEPALVTLTYMEDGGTAAGQDEDPIRFELKPGSRLSVNVDDALPNSWGVSTMVESDKPVIVERAMYYKSVDGTMRLSATDSIGVEGLYMSVPARYKDAAEMIEVDRGGLFVIALDTNPETGFKWALAQPLDENILRLSGQEYIPDTSPQDGPGSAGTECWTFEGVGEGETTIIMKYTKPFDEEAPGTFTREFRVSVR
jgi:predicted secreted protein